MQSCLIFCKPWMLLCDVISRMLHTINWSRYSLNWILYRNTIAVVDIFTLMWISCVVHIGLVRFYDFGNFIEFWNVKINVGIHCLWLCTIPKLEVPKFFVLCEFAIDDNIHILRVTYVRSGHFDAPFHCCMVLFSFFLCSDMPMLGYFHS